MCHDTPFSAGSEQANFTSQQGRTVSVRFVTEYDKNRLVELLRGLSTQTCLMRFFSPLPGGLPPEMAQAEANRLTQPNTQRQITLVATICEAETEKVIAVGELVRSDPVAAPEIALLVGDDYQREGIGSALVAQLGALARQRQISTVQAFILNENRPIQRLLQKLGLKYSSQNSYGERLLTISLA